MGRPQKSDSERFIHASIPAPRDLSAAQRGVWMRDITTMPPGFFAPCDTAALRLYTDVVTEYDYIHGELLRAEGDHRQELSKEFRAITALRLTCMRAEALAARAPPQEPRYEPRQWASQPGGIRHAARKSRLEIDVSPQSIGLIAAHPTLTTGLLRSAVKHATAPLRSAGGCIGNNPTAHEVHR